MMNYVIIVLTIILSAFFSASEIAFNSANTMRLKKNAEAGSKTAALALKICEDFTRPLSAILIGNNLVNIVSSTVATIVFMGFISSDGLASLTSTVVMTIIILIFGEITPKLVARANAEKYSKFFAYPIEILTIILFPIIFVILGIVRGLQKIWGSDKEENEPSITEDDLATIIDTVEQEGVINEDQSDLLQSTLEFPDTTIEEIMTPRIDTVYIDIDDTPTAIAEIIENSSFSRLPVYEDNIDNIIGIIYLNHYYKALNDCKGDLSKLDLRSLLLRPCLMHKTMKLPAALNSMRENKTHLAIVIDEFGGTMGIVTMEDILEELVGDIWDESDEIVAEIVRTGESTFEVNGDMNIDDFFESIEVVPHDFECEYSTVGGWAVEMLESEPHVGDSFTYENVYVVVNEMDDMRVTKLTALVTQKEEEEE